MTMTLCVTEHSTLALVPPLLVLLVLALGFEAASMQAVHMLVAWSGYTLHPHLHLHLHRGQGVWLGLGSMCLD